MWNDGIEAARMIRLSTIAGHDNRIPIIGLTAHVSKEYRDACREAGMNDFISKPFKKQDLLEAINRQVSRYSDPAAVSPLFLKNSDDLNAQEALGRLGGDRNLLREIWKIFIHDCPKTMNQLKKSLEAGNHAMSERHAHTLKSTAGNIGADRMKDTACRIETASREKRSDRAQSLYERLESDAERVLKTLRERIDRNTTRGGQGNTEICVKGDLK